MSFSILFYPTFLQAKDHFALNMAISVAVAEALQPFVGNTVELKWPNDIMISGLKAGGILIENMISSSRLDCSIVGIGINVNQPAFEIPQAASLLHFRGKELPLTDVFERLMEAIDANYLKLSHRLNELKPAYMSRLYRFKQTALYKDKSETFPGQITDVDENGRLCISTENGVRRYLFKEVEFI